MLCTSTHPYCTDWDLSKDMPEVIYSAALLSDETPSPQLEAVLFNSKAAPNQSCLSCQISLSLPVTSWNKHLNASSFRGQSSYLAQHLFQRGESLEMELYLGQHMLNFTGATFWEEVRLSYTFNKPPVPAPLQDAHVPIPV